jgi:hypothetical protein
MEPERGYSRCDLNWEVGANDGPEEVEQMLATMTKYGEMKEH